MWTLEGMLEAVLITLFSIYILGTSSISQSGYNSDLWLTSLTMYTSINPASQQSSSWVLSNWPHIPSFGRFYSSSPSFSCRWEYMWPICGCPTPIWWCIRGCQTQQPLISPQDRVILSYCSVYVWCSSLTALSYQSISKEEDTQVACVDSSKANNSTPRNNIESLASAAARSIPCSKINNHLTIEYFIYTLHSQTIIYHFLNAERGIVTNP